MSIINCNQYSRAWYSPIFNDWTTLMSQKVLLFIGTISETELTPRNRLFFIEILNKIKWTFYNNDVSMILIYFKNRRFLSFKQIIKNTI